MRLVAVVCGLALAREEGVSERRVWMIWTLMLAWGGVGIVLAVSYRFFWHDDWDDPWLWASFAIAFGYMAVAEHSRRRWQGAA